jgi:hypothetical protein
MNRVATAVLLVSALAIPTRAQVTTAPNYDEGDDPDHGVARLSLQSGDVSIQRGDTGEVVAGELNAPLVALDHVLTGPGSRAEIQFDWANMIRLGPVSEVRIGELRDNNYLIQVAEGTTTFRVLRDATAYVEISTPTVSVRPRGKGTFRIMVRPDGATEITVRSGEAEIFTPEGTETLRSGKTMQARGSAANPEYMIVNAIPKDDWDRWNEDRDRDLQRSQSYMYTSSSIYGADDLDAYGRWAYDSPYGWVWLPNVTAGWAPYRVGRWSWVNYYGWTWISGDPWGWAPYHYGSWYSSPWGWAWYPGAVRSRYYWRPALVSFFGWGGGGVNFGVSIGSGWNYANIGWVPLAPYEVYRPWYGRGYNVVNVTNVNVVNVYRNARHFNGRDGVTSVTSNTFGRGRVTNTNIVRVTDNDLRRAGGVQGRVPLETPRESRRFADSAPPAEVVTRVERRPQRQFATQSTAATVAGERDASRRAATVAVPTPTPAPVDRGANTADRGSRREAVVTAPSVPAPAPANDTGWRRFEGGTPAAQPGRREATIAPTAPRNDASGFRRAEPTPAPATVDRGRRQATEPVPQPRLETPTQPRVESRRDIVPQQPQQHYEPPLQPQVESRREVAIPQPQPRYEPPPQPRVESRRAEPAPPPPPPPQVESRREAPAPQAPRVESGGDSGGRRDAGSGDSGSRRR